MKHLSVAMLLILLANIRLGIKGLPGKNTLAYYEHLSVTAVKCFVTLAPVVKVLNHCGREKVL